MIAGHDTTLSAATNLAYQLAVDPALAERLRRQPELIARAVDESLRHRCPVQNRDPAQFVEPERFDLDRYANDREANRHLAYGWGVHRCPGEFLAEMELRVLLEELLH